MNRTERDIFVDTSAFIAMRVKDDVNHKSAYDFLNIIKDRKLRLHTTNFILDEVYTYFSKVHEIAIEMAELIINNPLITLHRIGVEDEDKALNILKDCDDKDFSYTDATTFAVMERLGMKIIFAFDEHFKQYGRFTAVPYNNM
ncbi:MAG: PIN domain-containing protein [Nitrospirota bacterium]